MSKNYLLADLVSRMSESSSLSKKDAQAFVQTFFNVLQESLSADTEVKVKGFGRFKISYTNTRWGVSVQSKELRKIESRPKVVFLPDDTLSETVNRPFSAFPTVYLDDDSAENSMDINPETDGSFPKDEIEKVEKIAESNSISLEEEFPAEKEKKSHMRMWCGGVILLIFLVVGAICLYQNKNAAPGSRNAAPSSTREALIEPVTSKKVDATPITTEEVLKRESKNTYIVESIQDKSSSDQMPPGEEDDLYEMIAWGEPHTIEAGENLNRLARDIYGDKSFTKYILRCNHFSDSNKIPVGKIIQLPILRKKR